MSKSCIPGYDDALKEERRIREEIFLDLPANICGFKIKQITPFLYARLCLMETPFLSDGEVTPREVTRFLWALSEDFSISTEDREAFQEKAIKLLEEKWDEAYAKIEKFLDDTFMDGPRGGGAESVPYVSGIAWMVFRMECDPHRWTRNRTLHTPMREIYQYMRCADIDRGRVMYNRSDIIKSMWLDELNAQGKGGKN